MDPNDVSASEFSGECQISISITYLVLTLFPRGLLD